ncbi:MAG: VWA domain-containing protein [Luminiphilus sp.]|nr:VWA domain-containing protein [Luminiphilus sp.]
MKRQRRASQEASISFLDVISCGFGAIVLLLVIAKVGDPAALEEAENKLRSTVTEYQERLFDVRGESVVLNEQLKSRKQQLSELIERVARLKAKLASIEKQSVQISQSEAREKEQLQLVMQVLSEEMERLLGPEFKQQNKLIGGIPVDSEYIIFIIDTSGSMFSYAWQRMLSEMEATLNIYPNVKGIQVMNDMGNYLFSRYAGQWIPDTPARRQLILRNLANWNAFSNSSPVEGITQAVRSFYDRDKKISIYVFGDEFTGRSIEDVVLTVDRLNAEADTQERRVRIHAVGFPVQFIRPPELQDTGIRFATLMRELTHRNGGTFVGLNDFRP